MAFGAGVASQIVAIVALELFRRFLLAAAGASLHVGCWKSALGNLDMQTQWKVTATVILLYTINFTGSLE